MLWGEITVCLGAVTGFVVVESLVFPHPPPLRHA
jgi:hypothetical protein